MGCLPALPVAGAIAAIFPGENPIPGELREEFVLRLVWCGLQTGSAGCSPCGMNFAVIHALVMRYIYLYGRNRVRLIELFFWPTMELLVWGNLSVWLESAKGSSVPTFVPMLIGGVILWDVVFRAQQGVAISFLEDVWTRNLLNIFAAPVRPVEYVAAGFVAGFLRILITVIVLTVLAAAFYHFNIFQLHWHLVPFFGLLMVFGWSLGLISSALILRWGQAAESLAWAVPFLIQPVAAQEAADAGQARIAVDRAIQYFHPLLTAGDQLIVAIDVHGAELVGVELAAIAAHDAAAIEDRAGRVEPDEGGDDQQQGGDEQQGRNGQGVVQAKLEPAVHAADVVGG